MTWKTTGLLFLTLGLGLGASASRADLTIVTPPKPSALETLAAREVRRYVYVRTGSLLPIVAAPAVPAGEAIVVASKGHAPATGAAFHALQPQQYALKTEGKVAWVVGGGDVGTLYGAYRLAEHLGVRFYLHGDVVPDGRIPLALPVVNETGKPLFETRGIQPFHDFPEGPDWWDTDDYLAYVGQLAKMRMNFLGLHCYPEGGVGPEPGVWIGPAGDAKADGTVTSAYPSQWASTMRGGMWGNATSRTSEFTAGASLLFPSDPFGPAVMSGMMPRPEGESQSRELFDRVALMFRAAFTRAKGLGIKTCIGTETPLTIPKLVQDRLKAQGKNPADPAVVRALYEGMFRHINAAHPLDYYWLWTPEGWTWGGNKPEELRATESDIKAALGALEALGHPFTLATCGWVLGPQNDRAALDRLLPKSSPMSCINRQVGHEPVEPAFAAITGRPKWAIPWMENDPDLTAPQPWVGRMRYDAADALRLGCTGLLGIHWRTKAMAPNVSALAAAGWDQSWAPKGFEQADRKGREVDGALGGTVVLFNAPVEGTEEDAVYQSVRYDMDGYHLNVPNGTYTVRLMFNEPHYKEAGKRVFGVQVQGKTIVESLDIFAKVGGNKALDVGVNGVVVSNGRLLIDFPKQTEFPCIAGIVVTGKTAPAGTPFTRKINCGGAKVGDYAADLESVARPNGHDRAMPVDDFYADFARASFGPEVAAEAGKILANIDGHHLPESATWTSGPGGVRVNPEPWSKVKEHYAFVAGLQALRPRVQGAGNLERFDYWLSTYKAMAAMAELGCVRGELDGKMNAMKAAKAAPVKADLAREARDIRVRMARLWETLISAQIGATDTPGELGTLSNLEQHSRLQDAFLSFHDRAIAEALGAPLPADAQPGHDYRGPARLIVPTVRNQVEPGESLRLKVIAVDRQPVRRVTLVLRTLGSGANQRLELSPAGRSAFTVTLPPAAHDFEYHVEAETASGTKLTWPATAPERDQTVIVVSTSPAATKAHEPPAAAGVFAPSEPPGGFPFPKSDRFVGLTFTGRHAEYTNADTWYPSWASDGNLYSSWTDGNVNGTGSNSFGTGATTGKAKIVGDDPLHLKVVDQSTYVSDASPYKGRYPCGTLVYNGVWYYGTYCLHPDGTVRKNGMDYNWPWLGPFVGFRTSTDLGKTWTQAPHTPEKPLFGEHALNGEPVRIGAPHFVDFGKNLAHSPDGKAYLVAQGASDGKARRFGYNSWITADHVYLARVRPSLETMNDAKSYEFFAGHDAKGQPLWTGELGKSQPIAAWRDHMGCVTMTYLAPSKTYMLCVTDGGNTVGYYDTYLLESSRVTGPFKVVAFLRHFGEQAYFVNIPSKFVGPDGGSFWLCYAANFSQGWNGVRFQSLPPGSRYGMCLQEVRLHRAGDITFRP